MRYIDADAVHEEIDAIQISLESSDDKVWKKNKPYYKGLAMARGVINEQPTADVVPKVIVNQIFEDIFMCAYWVDNKLVVSHDNILKIRDKFKRRLNL